MVQHFEIIILMATIITFISSNEYPWTSNRPFKQNKSPKGRDWMKNINSNTSIRSLAIPGTHDTCSYSFKNKFLGHEIFDYFATTQVWDLNDQLNAGIRYLDMRIGLDGNIYHNFVQTNESLKSVFQKLTDFINTNPSEGFIMRFKIESNRKMCRKVNCLEENLINVLREYNEYLLISSDIPCMKSLRGKIWIITEGFDFHDAMKWNSRMIALQDYYSLQGNMDQALLKKKDLFMKYINHNSEKLIINHCSATAIPWMGNLEIAQNINEVVLGNKNYQGIIVMDFPSEKVINHIIIQNDLS